MRFYDYAMGIIALALTITLIVVMAAIFAHPA